MAGLAFPDSSATENYIDEYESRRPKRTPYEIGWGYGADLGGLTGGPEAPGTEGEFAGGVNYPFKSYDGEVTFDRQTTGERTFDYPTEGVAHYGLYSDWFEDLQNLGVEADVARTCGTASEAYLEMWERAEGIRSPGCKPTSGKVTSRGPRPDRARRQAGSACSDAPASRSSATASGAGASVARRTATPPTSAELDKKGRVELAGSTANGRAAGGVAVGNRASALGNTRSIGSGVHLARADPTSSTRSRADASTSWASPPGKLAEQDLEAAHRRAPRPQGRGDQPEAEVRPELEPAGRTARGL